MSLKRYGVEGGTGGGGQHLPFACAVEADGWLYVSGQVPMVNGELVSGSIVTQSLIKRQRLGPPVDAGQCLGTPEFRPRQVA